MTRREFTIGTAASLTAPILRGAPLRSQPIELITAPSSLGLRPNEHDREP
jgi:hypothetical protein